MHLSTRLIPLGELGDRDLEAWRELAERAVEPNPFFDPDFVLPAARGLGAWDEVAILCVADWAACLPVRRYSRWHRLPLPCIATWLHSYCLLGTPLLASERPPDELLPILEEMRASVGQISFSALEWIPAEGPVAEALRQQYVSPIQFDAFSRATLIRRSQCDYLEGRVKGKHRREFRRMARGLGEELGSELELVNRANEPGAVEAFLNLEASGWKGRQATALAADPGHAEFFHRMARAFAERGALELLFLEAGGQAVATRCSLIAGDASFCFKVGYDERFRRYSPGRELELRLIKRFHEENRLSWMDSCANLDSELFNRLWPDRRTLVTLACRAPGALGLAARPALCSVAAVRGRRRRSHV